ncbi:MAG TPA: DUF4097 family beta strand repeat-containing protein [Gemmatimonadaceae bacterium]
MNRKFIASTVVSIASVVLTAATTPLAAQQNLGRNGTSWSWDGPVSSGQWTRIYSLSGPIKVVASPDGNVHVRGVKRVSGGGDASAVHYAVVRSADGVTICALWTDAGTCDENGAHEHASDTPWNDRHRNVEVSFNVQVPNGVRSGLHTISGDIEASGLSAQVKARSVSGSITATQIGSQVSAKSVSGDVTVSTSGGPLEAVSVSGDVNASLGSDGNSEMTLKSVSGSIDIGTPARFNADVDLSTVSGSIESKYALSYDRRHQHADGKIGNGGADVSAMTVSGSIKLR